MPLAVRFMHRRRLARKNTRNARTYGRAARMTGAAAASNCCAYKPARPSAPHRADVRGDGAWALRVDLRHVIAVIRRLPHAHPRQVDRKRRLHRAALG